MTDNLIVIDDKDNVVKHLNSYDTEYRTEFLIETYNVGYHINKGKKLHETLDIVNASAPCQVFLTVKSAKFSISDEEITKCAEVVSRRNLTVFVHTPYILNLANTDEYIVESLQKHLKVCSAMGFRGCVVHVGKQTKKEYSLALSIMKNNILESIKSATPECPLLLETPAGQGTEMLSKVEDFMEFMLDINDERLGICVDTCHIFASGYMPSVYINHILENEALTKMLKLFHYNDSKSDFGSCLDRHDLLCNGKMPMEELVAVACVGLNYNIPLVIEY